MKTFVWTLLVGILIWIIPFVVGMFFYDSSGTLATDVFLFKTVMILVLVSASGIAVNLFVRKAPPSSYAPIVVAGFAWASISLILDFLVLIPISGMRMTDYFLQIGLRYLTIPIICLTVVFAGGNMGSNPAD